MKLTQIGWRRLVAGLAGAALLALALPATAQADTGNLDPAAASSLTIHKYDGSAGAAGDGSALADTSALGNPLSGVQFTLTPVTAKSGAAINLDTSAGWDLIAGIKASDVTAAGSVYSKDAANAKVVTTNASGIATQALPHGLYLVTETSPGANNVVSPVDPFLVTLPLPQSGGKWLYDVHVYPKNAINKTVPTKTVSNPSSPVLGSTIDWTITAPVAPVGQGTLKTFTVVDTLDARLQYQGVVVKNAAATLVAGADYDVVQAGQKITVDLSKAVASGKVKPGDSPVVVLTTVVVSLGDGAIKNTALANTNTSGVQTNEPQSNWGVLKVHKHAAGDTSKNLAGAELAVYVNQADAAPVGTLTTAADGTATITLWVGNDSVVAKDYWIKETKAPAGYVLPANPWTQTNVKAGAVAVSTFDVPNTQQGHPDLPLTGANGRLYLMIGGGALLLLAIGAAIVVSRRRRV